MNIYEFFDSAARIIIVLLRLKPYESIEETIKLGIRMEFKATFDELKVYNLRGEYIR